MNMKKFITASMFTMLMILCSNINAETWNVPYIDVDGEAKCEVMPDELTLSIDIREIDYKGKKSIEAKQKELIEVLKLNGIKYNESLSIENMGSEVSVKFFNKNIKVRSEVRYILKLQDTETMQKVIDDLKDKEISNIKLIGTRYIHEEDLKLELGVEAMKKAKKEAEILAKSVGQSIGKAIYVNSWMSNNSRVRPQYGVGSNRVEFEDESSDSSMAEVPSIAKLTYTVNVSVKFELK